MSDSNTLDALNDVQSAPTTPRAVQTDTAINVATISVSVSITPALASDVRTGPLYTISVTFSWLKIGCVVCALVAVLLFGLGMTVYIRAYMDPHM
jgi:hypothetical protein